MKTRGRVDPVRVVGVGAMLLVVIVVVAPLLVVAQAESKLRSNARKAVNTLRTLVTQENMWHKQDVDGNATNDYWAIDVAGLYRAIRQPRGTEAMMIDIATARSDWSPDGNGDGGGGEFPIVALAYAAGTQVPGLAAMAHTAPVPKSGYYVAAFRNNAAGTAYACDLDGAGQAYENTSRFAFMAFPDTYNGTGKNAYIVDAAGAIFYLDAAVGKYNLPKGPVNGTLPPDGTCPVTNWPNANPYVAGYELADGSEESDEEDADDDEEGILLPEKGSSCPLCGKELDSPIRREDVVRALARLQAMLTRKLSKETNKLLDIDCTNNLKQLGLYIHLWVAKFGGETKYPGPGMKLLFDLFNHPDQKTAIAARSHGLLVCPKANDKRPTAESVAACDPTCTSYECTKDQLDDTYRPSKPIMWDKKPVHDGRRNVLFFDGSVDSLTEEQFQKALKEYEGKK